MLVGKCWKSPCPEAANLSRSQCHVRNAPPQRSSSRGSILGGAPDFFCPRGVRVAGGAAGRFRIVASGIDVPVIAAKAGSPTRCPMRGLRRTTVPANDHRHDVGSAGAIRPPTIPRGSRWPTPSGDPSRRSSTHQGQLQNRPAGIVCAAANLTSASLERRQHGLVDPVLVHGGSIRRRRTAPVVHAVRRGGDCRTEQMVAGAPQSACRRERSPSPTP